MPGNYLCENSEVKRGRKRQRERKKERVSEDEVKTTLSL